MRAEEIIDQLIEVIREGRSLPLMKDKVVLEPDKLFELLDELRIALPQEMRQAKAIVADRTKIVDDAKAEAESMIKAADERRRAMVSDNEIVKQAKATADQMLTDAKLKSKEVRKAANDYVEEIMRRADEMLTANVNELRKTRQSIKASQRQGS